MNNVPLEGVGNDELLLYDMEQQAYEPLPQGWVEPDWLDPPSIEPKWLEPPTLEQDWLESSLVEPEWLEGLSADHEGHGLVPEQTPDFDFDL